MKTFKNFIAEATEDDLRGMGASSKAIEELKRRRQKRGYGFDRGDDRAQKPGVPNTKKPAPNTGVQKALPGSVAPGTKEQKPAPSTSSQIVPTKEKKPASSQIVSTRQQETPKPKSVPDEKQAGTQPGTTRGMSDSAGSGGIDKNDEKKKRKQR